MKRWSLNDFTKLKTQKDYTMKLFKFVLFLSFALMLSSQLVIAKNIENGYQHLISISQIEEGIYVFAKKYSEPSAPESCAIKIEYNLNNWTLKKTVINNPVSRFACEEHGRISKFICDHMKCRLVGDSRMKSYFLASDLILETVGDSGFDQLWKREHIEELLPLFFESRGLKISQPEKIPSEWYGHSEYFQVSLLKNLKKAKKVAKDYYDDLALRECTRYYESKYCEIYISYMEKHDFSAKSRGGNIYEFETSVVWKSQVRVKDYEKKQ